MREDRCLYVLYSTIRLVSVWRSVIEGNKVFIVMFCIYIDAVALKIAFD